MDTIKFSLVKDTFNLERNAQRDINVRYCEKVVITNDLMRKNDIEGAKLVANQSFAGAPVNISINPETTPEAINTEVLKDALLEKRRERLENLKEQEQKHNNPKEYSPTKFTEIRKPEPVVNIETSGNVSRRIQTDGSRLPKTTDLREEVSVKILRDAGRPYFEKGVYHANKPSTKEEKTSTLQSTQKPLPFVPKQNLDDVITAQPTVSQSIYSSIFGSTQRAVSAEAAFLPLTASAASMNITALEEKETPEEKKVSLADKLKGYTSTSLTQLIKDLGLKVPTGGKDAYIALLLTRKRDAENFVAHHKPEHVRSGYGLRKKRKSSKKIRGGNLRKAGTGYSKGYLPASKELLKQKISVLSGELSAGNDGVKSVLKQLAGSAIKKGILTKAQVKKLVSK